MSLKQRRELVDGADAMLSVSDQCRLLKVHRSSYYYKHKGISAEDLELMEKIDRLYSQDATRGSRRMRRDLKLAGFHASRSKIRRLMAIMALKTIYARPRTTISDPAAYKYPYLLRGLEITKVNQVWQIDISYIPMKRGFMYLVAIIDVYSRFIVGWSLSNTMEAEWIVGCVKQSIQRHGMPEIINSDQGSQFTGHEYVDYITSLEYTKISMDGKGRATDNAYIERFFRSIKYECIYLYELKDGQELFDMCKTYISFYNEQRGHSSIDDRTPSHVFRRAA
jgi:putative transposase